MKLLICTQVVDRSDSVLGFFHEWIAECGRQYESVEVICLKEGKHSLPLNVTVHSLGKERGFSRVRRIFLFFKYSIFLRKKYDAVFVHMNPEYVILGGFLWRLFKKDTGMWYAHGAVTLKLRISALFAHHLFTSTPQGLRIRSPKIHIVGQGIDTERFVPGAMEKNSPRDDAIKLVTVSRISESKDIACLIEAVALLKKDALPVSLTIVGEPLTAKDKEYEGYLKKRIEELGITDQILWEGPIQNSDLPHVLRRHTVFVNAYKNNSLDKALLEAMATGLIVVSSNESYVGLINDMLPVHSNSVCVAHGTPEAFEDAIKKVSELPERKRVELSASLRDIVVAEHGLPGLIDRIMSFYSPRV